MAYPLSLSRQTKEFKTHFLIEFTRQLIRNSAPTDIFDLENVVKEEEKEIKQKIKKGVQHKITSDTPFQSLSKKIKYSPSFKPIQTPPQRKSIELRQIPIATPIPRIIQRKTVRRKLPSDPKRRITIPEPKLPPELNYIRPVPTEVPMDLGKLNPFIKDPIIKSIECYGADQNIIIHRARDSQKTNIILTKEEIDEIIKRFSQSARIPLQEGIFKVAVGNLVLLAIVSNVISSKFTIKKIMYRPPVRR